MIAKNIQRVEGACLSVVSIVHGTEYAVKLPGVRIPVYQMTREPAADRKRVVM